MPWLDQCKALVHGYLCGQAGAGAVLKAILGEINPSGKLSDTIARSQEYIRDLEEMFTKSAPVDLDSALSSLNSRLGYLHHFNEYTMTAKAIEAAPKLREVFQFTPSYNKAIIKPINHE